MHTIQTKTKLENGKKSLASVPTQFPLQFTISSFGKKKILLIKKKTMVKIVPI